jgi:hypothetical protein
VLIEEKEVNPKYRMMLDRSGESLETIQPGQFGWNPLEWFTLASGDIQAPHGGPLRTGSGSISIGLRLGHAYQYLTQVMVGKAPLAGVLVDIMENGRRKVQLKFRDVDVKQVTLTKGVGSVELDYAKLDF